MTLEEMFDQAFATAVQDRRDLIRFLEGVSETQARWKPPDGEWSILEGLEHIMLTEERFRTLMLKTLREAEASGRWDNAPPRPVKMSLETLRRREQGFVPAPEELLPRGAGRFAQMIQELIPARQATREAFLPYRSRDLSRLVPPPGRYGDLNLYERIAYSGIHDALHREQMERVTRQPGFPRE